MHNAVFTMFKTNLPQASVAAAVEDVTGVGDSHALGAESDVVMGGLVLSDDAGGRVHQCGFGVLFGLGLGCVDHDVFRVVDVPRMDEPWIVGRDA